MTINSRKLTRFFLLHSSHKISIHLCSPICQLFPSESSQKGTIRRILIGSWRDENGRLLHFNCLMHTYFMPCPPPLAHSIIIVIMPISVCSTPSLPCCNERIYRRPESWPRPRGASRFPWSPLLRWCPPTHRYHVASPEFPLYDRRGEGD